MEKDSGMNSGGLSTLILYSTNISSIFHTILNYFKPNQVYNYSELSI